MRNRIALIDISTKKFKVLSYKQYDENNLLRIVIIENKNIVDISNYIATIYFELPSGKTYKINGDIKDNTINVMLSSNILSEYGKVIVEVELSYSSQIVTTFSIYLNVEESISKSEYSNPDNPNDPDNPSIIEDIPNIEILKQITQEKIDEWNNKSDFDGNYDSLINAPTNLSDFNNDIGFITSDELNNYATKDEVPTKTSQLENDSDFATNSSVDEKIANIQLDDEKIDLSEYAKKTDIPTKTSQLENDNSYATENYVINKIAEAQLSEGEVNLSDYQTREDLTLETTDKTVVGAINEVNANVMMKANDSFEASMSTVSSLGGIPAGTDLNGMSLQQVLTKLLFPYIKPSVSASLTYSPTSSIYEFGQEVLVTRINTTVSKKSESISSIKFYQNNTLIETITDCSNGGTFSYTYDTPISIKTNTSNSYFKVIVNDGTSDVTANTNSFTFVYPYYYGVIANDAIITEDLIKGLTKQVVAKGNKSYTYSPNFEKMVIAYPKSYGVLKSILDPNGFEQMASFTVTELNIVGLDGTSQVYYVYTNGASTNTNFIMQFKY